MAVANYTPDSIPWQFQGKRGVIKPGDVVKGRSRGWENHILNKMGPRGLVRLEFEEDAEKAKQRSMQTYEEFWMKQIRVFNERNEQQKNEGRQYTPPTKELSEKADLFGIELVGPWKLRLKPDGGEGEGSGADASRVRKVEDRVGAIESQVNDIYEMLKANLAGGQDQKPAGAGDSSSKKGGSGKK